MWGRLKRELDDWLWDHGVYFGDYRDCVRVGQDARMGPYVGVARVVTRWFWYLSIESDSRKIRIPVE